MIRTTTSTALAALAALACLLPALASHALIRKVPEQYATIQLALDDARDGDIVLVAPGNYQERLTVSRSVYLISEEPGGAVLDADLQDAITVNHVDMFQLIGFVIHNCRAAVLATESSGAIIDTEIAGCMPMAAFEDVITFSGSGDATVSGVEIDNTEATDSAVGQLGLYIDGHALVRDTVLGHSGGAGLVIDGSAGALIDSVSEGSGGDAVSVSADVMLVARNTIETSDGSGIVVTDGDRVMVLGNAIERTEFGVEFFTDPGFISEAWVYDNSIHDTEQAGLVALSDIGSLTIGRNDIRDGGSRGIWLQDADMTALVHDNAIVGNGALGISVGLAADGFLESSDVTIRRNLIAENVTHGIQIQDSDALVANNTIVDNGDFGIFHETSLADPEYLPTFRNNLLVGHQGSIAANDGYGLWADFAPTPCNLDHTLLWDNTFDVNLDGDDLPIPCMDGDGMLFEDPLFVDPDNGDWSLGPGSPGVDAGDPDPAYDDEDGSRNDLGADGGPAEPAMADDEPPSLSFAAEDDLPEGQDRIIRLPDDVDPEGYPVFAEWEITGGTNGTWTAYGETVLLYGEDDGEFEWTVTVTDPFGGTASADGSLTVVNLSPGITSSMPTTGTVGQDWHYQVEVFDPGYFDTFDYEVALGPKNMEIDAFGAVVWTPTSDQIGDWTIKIVVIDDDGASSEQIETVTISAGAPGDDDDDCSCDVDGRPAGAPALALLTLAAALMLRRRIQ